ncbi:hypothetical protein CDD83_2106 [Cordyceps sp. RAO-2017]|nr:hypothetical protein CDD83_2106 [Cordyceps sp. RAO-2017]
MPWLRLPAHSVRRWSVSTQLPHRGASGPLKRSPSKGCRSPHLVQTIFSRPPCSWTVGGQGPLGSRGTVVRRGSMDVSMQSMFCE